MSTIERINQFVEETNSTTSRTLKIEIVKKYSDLKQFFEYHYNDLITYGVTSKSCKKHNKHNQELSFGDSLEDLLTLLQQLISRKITGHTALETVNAYINSNKQYEQLIHNILDKNLQNRLGSKDINSAFKDLIPEFSIALASQFAENASLIKSSTWKVSTKLDGIRLIAIKNGHDIKFYSRSGNEYLTLEAYKEDIIKNVNIENCILDGELIYVTDNGSDDFKQVMTQVTKKDYQVTNLTYMIFDVLTHEEFFSKESKDILSKRLERTKDITESDKIKILPQYTYTEEVFTELLKEYREKDWEGFIFRKDTTYKGKRSKDILKWKEFFEEEFTVVDVEYDTKQMLVDGVNQQVNCLANCVIEYKGNRVSVGSGFSDAERLKYYTPDEKNPLVESVITVSYKKETSDKTGKLSLQFPTIKAIHGKKRIT